MFRHRTLATSALLLGLAASAFTTGCRRKPRVKQPQTPVAALATPAVPASLTLTVTASASGLARITTDPGDEADPAVSPDGKTLLFGVQITNGAGTVQQAIAGPFSFGWPIPAELYSTRSPARCAIVTRGNWATYPPPI